MGTRRGQWAGAWLGVNVTKSCKQSLAWSCTCGRVFWWYTWPWGDQFSGHFNHSEENSWRAQGLSGKERIMVLDGQLQAGWVRLCLDFLPGFEQSKQQHIQQTGDIGGRANIWVTWGVVPEKWGLGCLGQRKVSFIHRKGPGMAMICRFWHHTGSRWDLEWINLLRATKKNEKI